MLSTTSITFLGTSSAVPSATRNHSSLALRMDSDVWIFDCGEATQNRLQQSPIKMGRIRKIFITHTHGDHIFGLVPLLASALNGAGGTVDPEEDDRVELSANTPPVEIYGPLGTRFYVRSALKATHTNLAGRYVVHELRFPSDPVQGDEHAIAPHACELVGGDIPQSDNNAWLSICDEALVTVHAAPILHSVPCVGYVISEKPIPGKVNLDEYKPHLLRNKAALKALGINNPFVKLGDLQKGNSVQLPDGTVLQPPNPRPGFKVVILGDACDPSGIADLARNADVLVHEATNAHLPHVEGARGKSDDTFELVEARSKSHGHSTPQMAGSFATLIQSKMLVLNHFSSRYPGNDDVDEASAAIMKAIADLARDKFSGPVICARDLMTVNVQRPNVE